MEILDHLKEWLDENPVAPDWHQEDVPLHIQIVLGEVYYDDPKAFAESVAKYPGWELTELRNNDDDKHGWFVMIKTPYGQVTVYSDTKTFTSMGETVLAVNKANETWYGRLWLRFIFWVYRDRNNKS